MPSPLRSANSTLFVQSPVTPIVSAVASVHKPVGKAVAAADSIGRFSSFPQPQRRCIKAMDR